MTDPLEARGCPSVRPTAPPSKLRAGTWQHPAGAATCCWDKGECSGTARLQKGLGFRCGGRNWDFPALGLSRIPACPRETNNGVFTAGAGMGWRNPNFTRSATTSGWATRGHCSTPQRGARKTEPSIVLPVMHASFIVMSVIKGFLVINSDVLPHCLFPPLFFSWPAIITNIPVRCSGTRPIGLGTKAAEKVLKACQRYLTCISQVLYKAKSSWARRTVGGPRGPRHSPPPRAKMRPGWGDSREGARRGTVEGNSRAQHDENLQFSSSLVSGSFSLVKEKGTKVKTQN